MLTFNNLSVYGKKYYTILFLFWFWFCFCFLLLLCLVSKKIFHNCVTFVILKRKMEVFVRYFEFCYVCQFSTTILQFLVVRHNFWFSVIYKDEFWLQMYCFPPDNCFTILVSVGRFCCPRQTDNRYFERCPEGKKGVPSILVSCILRRAAQQLVTPLPMLKIIRSCYPISTVQCGHLIIRSI